METIMTNQQILEMLSENEYILFYTLDDDPNNEALRAAHKSIKQALIDFAHATGCRLN